MQIVFVQITNCICPNYKLYLSKLPNIFVFYQVVISPGLIDKMEATIEAELVEEDEGKIYTAADLFRLPVR